MWILFARSPRPDARYWRGRCFLAALDALLWPSLWLAAVASVPFATGIVGVVAVGALIVLALRRLHCALWQNGRYRFTTWRWGAWLSLASAMGLLAKFLAD